jgi:hypothetical protein
MSKQKQADRSVSQGATRYVEEREDNRILAI